MVCVVRKVQICQLALCFDSIIYCYYSYPAKKLSSSVAFLNKANDLASSFEKKIFFWGGKLLHMDEFEDDIHRSIAYSEGNDWFNIV